MEQGLLTELDWRFTPEGIVVPCKNERHARRRVEDREEYRKWATLAARFGLPRALLQYKVPGKREFKAFPVQALPTTPEQASGEARMTVINSDLRQVYTSPKLGINAEFRKVMDLLIESDRPMFLLSNGETAQADDPLANWQLWINQLACNMIESSGERATQRNIANYWDGRDLEGLYQKLRDTDQPFEHRYRAILNDNQPDIWFEAVSLYRPVTIAGKSYRLSINQHFEIIGQADLVTFR